MLQYVLRRSTTIYPLYALLGMLYWPDDSLSLCFLCGPWKGYNLFMEDIPKKTIEIQEVLSTPINNHFWGGGFIFCVHPYLFTKMNPIRRSYFKMGGSNTKQWNILQIVSSLHINHSMPGLKMLQTFTRWAPTIVVNGVIVPIYGWK